MAKKRPRRPKRYGKLQAAPTLERVELSSAELAEAVRNTPIRHESLPKELEPVLRWTYRHLGCKTKANPTYEQWEIGFMRDTNPVQEIVHWARTTWAYLEYLRRHSGADEKQIFKALMAMVIHAPMEDGFPSEAEQELRELYQSPPPELSDPTSSIFQQ